MVIIEELNKSVVDAGADVIKFLRQANGLRIHVAFWMHDKWDNAYQLSICTSGTRTKGPLELYKNLGQDIRDTNVLSAVKLSTRFLSDKDGISIRVYAIKQNINFGDRPGALMRPPSGLDTQKAIFIYR